MTRTNSGKSLAGIVLVLGAVVVLGIAAYVKFAPADVIPREVDPVGEGKVTILVPSFGEELTFVPQAVEVPEGIDPMVYTVNRYLGTLEVVPSEAVAERIEVKDGVASVYFSKEFRRSYGTEDEEAVIKGILTSLGQFPDVSFVKFYAGGRPLETLGNSMLTDQWEVLRRPDLEVDD